VQHGGQQRVIDLSAVQARDEAIRPRREAGGPLRKRRGVGAIDDFVGVAGEAVERVHMASFPRGQ
jgi:hypothetical protein